MIEVNLLPKSYRKKAVSFSLGKTGLYFMAGGAAVIVTLIVITFLQVSKLGELDEGIERAKRRADMLRQDIEVVDALTEVKNKITRRVTAIEQLDRNRSAWVRIMEEIAGDVPDYVWVTNFAEGEEPTPPGAADEDGKKSKKNKDKKKDDKAEAKKARAANEPTVKEVTMEGYAFTLNSIAAFMINLMRSEYFDQIELVYTNETAFDEHRAYNFVLQGHLHFLSDEQARKMIAQTQAEEQASRAAHQSLN
jgi:Tfp pilus assembly protein PilN